MNPHRAPDLLHDLASLALRGALLAWALLALVVGMATPARAQAQTSTPAAPAEPWLAGPVLAELQRSAAGAALQGRSDLRVVVTPGALDSRLKLAPCGQIQAFVPPGAPAWGRTRAGLRCTDGQARWSVTLPLQVQVFARTAVAATALPAGTVINAAHLAEAEVDLSAQPQPALPAGDLLGRTLARGVAAGQAMRGPDLKTRQWFAAGETVRVVALGAGFAVSAEAEALTAGLEGQTSRVRLESGRVVVGKAVGERRLEVNL